MTEVQKKFDFYCDGKVAGYFMGMATYPTISGRYRYMPYRSVGHWLIGKHFKEAGFALCTWGTPDHQVPFVARSSGEYGFLLIDRIGEQS